MPHLKELYAEHKQDGLEIVGVHSKRGGGAMADFVEENEIPYPTAVDVEGLTVKAYAVDSYPDYYLVDRAGKLRFADLANAELDRAIEMLLAEPAPKKGAER